MAKKIQEIDSDAVSRHESMVLNDSFSFSMNLHAVFQARGGHDAE